MRAITMRSCEMVGRSPRRFDVHPHPLSTLYCPAANVHGTNRSRHRGRGSHDLPDPLRPETGPPREFCDSRTYYGLWGLILGGMSVASINSILGIPGAVFFGAYSLWAWGRTLFPKVRVRVTKVGIIDETFWASPGLIEWSEVLDVRPSRWGQIHIEVRKESAVLQRMSRPARITATKLLLLGPGPTSIVCWALSSNRESILRALEDGMDEHALRTFHKEAAAAPSRPEAP